MKNKLLSLLVNVALCFAFLVFYFLVIIKLRVFLITWINEVLINMDYENFLFSNGGRVLYFAEVGASNYLMLKTPFDSTYLLSALVVIFMRVYKSLLIISLIPVIGFIISVLILFIAASSALSILLIVPGMFGRYLVPISCLGYVAILFDREKPKNQVDEQVS